MNTRQVCAIGVIGIAALLGWPMAKDATANKIVSAAMRSNPDLASNGIAQGLAYGVGIPIVRAKIESEDIGTQIGAVIEVLVFNNVPDFSQNH